MKQFLIAQIGTASQVQSLVPQSAGIFATVLWVDPLIEEASFFFTVFGGEMNASTPDPVDLINSVTSDGVVFTQAQNYAELYVDKNSFFWEYSTQTLYVRLLNDMDDFRIPTEYAKGVVLGVCDRADWKQDGTVDITIGGTVYNPVLSRSGFTADVSIDDWKNNIMIFSNFNLNLNNADGAYDGDKISLINQRCDVLLADIADNKDLELSDFQIVRTGIVRDIAYPNLDSVTIYVEDLRKTLDSPVPLRTYQLSDFPDQTAGNYPEDLIDKTMPFCVGRMRYAPAYRLNPNSANVGAVFHYQDTDYGPVPSNPVVYELVSESVTRVVTNVTHDLANGKFTIATGSNFAGNELVVDGYGLTISYILENGIPVYYKTNGPIILSLFIIQTLGLWRIDQTTYDRDSTNVLDAWLNIDNCGYYFPVGGKKIKEALDSILLPIGISLSTQTGLLVFNTIELYGDYEPFALSVYDLYAPPAMSYNVDLFMSSVELSYLIGISAIKSGADITSKTITLTDKETELAQRFGRQFRAQPQTIMSDDDDALIVATRLYDRFGFVPVQLACSYNEPLGLNLLDPVTFEYDWHGRKLFPEALYRVTQIDPINRTMVLTQYEDLGATSNAVISMYHRSQGA